MKCAYIGNGKKEEVGHFSLRNIWEIRHGFIGIKYFRNYESCQWGDVFEKSPRNLW